MIPVGNIARGHKTRDVLMFVNREAFAMSCVVRFVNPEIDHGLFREQELFGKTCLFFIAWRFIYING